MEIIVKSTSKNQNKVCGLEPPQQEENKVDSPNSKPLVYIGFSDGNYGILKSQAHNNTT